MRTLQKYRKKRQTCSRNSSSVFINAALKSDSVVAASIRPSGGDIVVEAGCNRGLIDGFVAAEDILHDMGAISIISSDSQAMGRIGEVGKLADLVIWKPSFFRAKPEIAIKGGDIAYANMGDPNASIPTPQPVIMRPMFGAFGKAGSANSIAFVRKAAMDCNIKTFYGLNKKVTSVNTSKVTKLDMKLNDALPQIEVDPETYAVTADGVHLTCVAATTVPLSRNYFLF
ncbi:urease isoform X2 [Tanacetum coccineum]